MAEPTLKGLLHHLAGYFMPSKKKSAKFRPLRPRAEQCTHIREGDRVCCIRKRDHEGDHAYSFEMMPGVYCQEIDSTKYIEYLMPEKTDL
jgi:hypothetical protein